MRLVRRRHRLRPYPAKTTAVERIGFIRTAVAAAERPARSPPAATAAAPPARGPARAGRRRRAGASRSTNSAGSWSPRGGPPGSRSSSVHGDQRRQPGGGERVEDQRAAGPQQPRALGEDRDVVLDVLEDLAGQRRRRRSRRPAAPPGPSRAPGGTPCSRASAQAGQPEVDADVPVAQRGRRAGAMSPPPQARSTSTRRPGGGRRDVLGPRGGQPVQRGELAVGPPPLVGQLVVLRRVVAGTRDGRRGGTGSTSSSADRGPSSSGSTATWRSRRPPSAGCWARWRCT